MAPKAYQVRLKKEYEDIIRDPIPHIAARPNPKDLLQWHYAIIAPSDSDYAGGVYHGKIIFPEDYPLRPPSIYMITPNGRFKTNTLHPETWNPMWKVSSILLGLLSFMLEEDSKTLGSIETTKADKRRFAKESHAFNGNTPLFRQLFPDLLRDASVFMKRSPSSELSAASRTSDATSEPSTAQADSTEGTTVPVAAPARLSGLQQGVRAVGMIALVAVIAYVALYVMMMKERMQ